MAGFQPRLEIPVVARVDLFLEVVLRVDVDSELRRVLIKAVQPQACDALKLVRNKRARPSTASRFSRSRK